MLRMLDRHAVQELLRAGLKPRAVAQQFRVSRRTIERIAGEEKVRSGADGILRRAGDEGRRSVGRPRVTEAMLLEAIDFIFCTAGARPCVINMSLGTQCGPHDGSSLSSSRRSSSVGVPSKARWASGAPSRIARARWRWAATSCSPS
jgi:hypothetical protein